MKKDRSIKLRAAFLFIVFALNTMVAFACSIGVDMGFNKIQNGSKATVHIHKDGKKHLHAKKGGHHNKSNGKANSQNKSEKDKDNCCTEKVRHFEQLDKSIRHPFTFDHPVSFTTFVVSYFNVNASAAAGFVKDIKPFVRSYHPPIPDIRIAIQSFQV